ncbi:MAG: 3-phosphoglycerate dehydrogenase [Bacteroidales bacterium]
MKILVATVKPFAKEAVDGIKKIVEKAGNTFSLLEKYENVDELYKAVADADAMIVRSDKITKEVIDHAKNLKIVVRAGAGYDNLDLEACTKRGIIAMNTPGQNSNAVAELACSFMVFMSRNQFNPKAGSELKGKTLGIQAYGHVGRLVAGIAKNGFGMKIMAFDPFVPAEAMEKEGVIVAKNLEELYSHSNFVSLHIPATKETKGSIGYDLVSKMPKGGCLVNTARKEVIDENGIIKALTEREDLKYITDIAADKMGEMREKFGDRVFGTPKKMGAQTKEANVNAGLAAANQICGFFANGTTKFQVNK